MLDRQLTGRKLALPLTLGGLLVIHGALPAGWPAFALAFCAALLWPGWLLSGLLFSLPLGRRLPVAFTLSIALLSLPTVLLLRLEASLPVLTWVISAIILALAACAFFFEKPPHEEQFIPGRLPLTLLIPALLAAGAALAFWAYRAPISDAGDHWFYLQFIRRFLDHGLSADVNPLAGQAADPGTLLRAGFNSWWALQAVVFKASGLDLLEAYWYGLPPLLMVLSFLAVYGFAWQLFKKPGPALAAVLFHVLLVFTSIDSHSWPGNGFFLRIAEDKYLVMFVLLPTALGLLLQCLESPRWGSLAVAGLGLLGISLTHPFGFFQWVAAAVGLLLAVLLRRALSSGARGLWLTVAGLALLLAGIPLVFQSLVFQPFDTTLAQEPPYTSQTIVLDAQAGKFVGSPHVIAHPLILLAIGLTPVLFKWLDKDRAARFLLGATWLPLLFAFHPFFAAFLGRFGGPWLVWRITWALPVALVLAYIFDKLEPAVRTSPGFQRAKRGGTTLAVLALLIFLMRAYLYDGIGLMRDQKHRFVPPQEVAVLEAVRAYAAPGDVVLAPPLQNNHLPAFSSESQLISFRVFEARLGALDNLVWFYSLSGSNQEAFDFLQAWDVRLVVLRQDQALPAEWKSMPDFFVELFANEAFALFEVMSFPQAGEWDLPDLPPAPQAAAQLLHPAENDLREGNASMETGDFDRALEAYTNVLEREPEIFGLRPAKGIWKAWGRNLTFDRRADRIGEALSGMGAIYEQRSQWGLAENVYRQWIDLLPDREAGYAALARVYEQTGRQDQVLRLFQEAARTFFWLVWPKTGLSDAYLALDRNEEAAAELKAALRLEPDNVFTLVHLARLYRVERELDLALSFGLQAESRALSVHEIAQANYELGQVYWASGQKNLALAHFLHSAEVLPDNPVLHATIGDFHHQAENDPQAALPYYLTAVSLAPDNAAYRLLLGDIYRDLGDEENASQAYEAAAQLNPDLPGLYERQQEIP